MYTRRKRSFFLMIEREKKDDLLSEKNQKKSN